jgi:transglutaminase-like putative cysteine protease
MSKKTNVPPALGAAAIPWLLLAVGLAAAAHIGRLPWWLNGLFILAAGWRWQAALKRWPMPRGWLLLGLTLSTIAGLLAYYGTLLGREAGVALLAAMTALKLLEARTLRDGMVVIFLGYFLLIAHLLNSQTMATAVYLLLALAALIGAQVLIQPQHAGLQPVAALRLSVVMLLQSLPIMLILFILFPRIPGPLWGLPKDAYSGFTGLSESMTPGSISELIQSDEVAFRVRFKGAAPLPEKLYWRGPVLWWYRDRTWSGRDEELLASLPYIPRGERVDYTVTLEPHGQRWLFALDLPGALPREAGMTRTLQLKNLKPVNERYQYAMHSYLRYATGELSELERRLNLQLPATGNPRARALAEQWRRQAEKYPRAVVDQALVLFREQPFYYTLTPPLLGADSVDEFLFDTRRGFCEHYAGSFVFLLRAAGVPARVVTGYQGGERNGDYYIVRQSDAHAWAEVWLEGSGWTRIDPTAAVAPERIERGIFAALDDPALLPLLARRDSSWLRRLALGWDTVNNAWNEWVLGYNDQRQQRFLSGVGFGPVDWRGMTVALVIALVLVACAAAGLHLLRRWRRRDPLARTYEAFCRKLARQGLARQPHEGPLAFTERIARARPELAIQARGIGRLYALQRYGGSHNAAALRRLQRLVARFGS